MIDQVVVKTPKNRIETTLTILKDYERVIQEINEKQKKRLRSKIGDVSSGVVVFMQKVGVTLRHKRPRPLKPIRAQTERNVALQ